MREYASIWLHGGNGGRFEGNKVFSFLSNSWLAVLSDAVTVFGVGRRSGVAWRPPWDGDHFGHWIASVMQPHDDLKGCNHSRAK